MKSKIMFLLPLIFAFSTAAFLQIYPPRVGNAAPNELPTLHVDYTPLIDTPDIAALKDKQASNDSMRRANRVKNFRRLEEIERSLAASEKQAQQAYQMTVAAARRAADSAREKEALAAAETDTIEPQPRQDRKRGWLWFSFKNKKVD